MKTSEIFIKRMTNVPSLMSKRQNRRCYAKLGSNSVYESLLGHVRFLLISMFNWLSFLKLKKCLQQHPELLLRWRGGSSSAVHSCVHGLRGVPTPLEATGPNWVSPPPSVKGQQCSLTAASSHFQLWFAGAWGTGEVSKLNGSECEPSATGTGMATWSVLVVLLSGPWLIYCDCLHLENWPMKAKNPIRTFGTWHAAMRLASLSMPSSY